MMCPLNVLLALQADELYLCILYVPREVLKYKYSPSLLAGTVGGLS